MSSILLILALGLIGSLVGLRIAKDNTVHKLFEEPKTQSKGSTKSREEINLNFEPVLGNDISRFGTETYSNYIKRALVYFKDNCYIGEDDWFINNCRSLRDQNYRIKLIYKEYNYLISRLSVGNLEQIKTWAVDIFMAYSKNQKDAIEYIDRFYSGRDDGTYKELKEPMSALIHDNHRLITGLKEFCETVRAYLASLYHDDAPAHLTDFTSLELLNQASKHINSAIINAENEHIQTINEEMEARLEKIPKITIIGSDAPLMEFKRESQTEEATSSLMQDSSTKNQ